MESYISAMEILKNHKKEPNFYQKDEKNFWPHYLYVGGDDYLLTLVLNEWKKTPPKKEVLEDFKILINKEYPRFIDPDSHHDVSFTIGGYMIHYGLIEKSEEVASYIINLDLLKILVEFGYDTSPLINELDYLIDPILDIRDKLLFGAESDEQEV
jgi:hypothetical protein